MALQDPLLLCHTIYARVWYSPMQTMAAQHLLPYFHSMLRGTSTVHMYQVPGTRYPLVISTYLRSSLHYQVLVPTS